MIEFLMFRMKNHMDMETYESMLLRWKESSSSTEKMQEWVETVQSIIGKGVYESIKKEFRDIEDKKKEKKQKSAEEAFPYLFVVRIIRNMVYLIQYLVQVLMHILGTPYAVSYNTNRIALQIQYIVYLVSSLT